MSQESTSPTFLQPSPPPGHGSTAWTPGTWSLDCQSDHRLVATNASGVRLEGVSFVRLFPYTVDDGPISMVDARGKEVVLLDGFAVLPANVSDLIRAHLARREFLTTIQRVVSSSSSGIPTDWLLETNRGPLSIRIRDEDAFRTLPRGELLITDDSGARFLVPSIEALDAHSRAIVRRFA
jgi:hypothetical protein